VRGTYPPPTYLPNHGWLSDSLFLYFHFCDRDVLVYSFSFSISPVFFFFFFFHTLGLCMSASVRSRIDPNRSID